MKSSKGIKNGERVISQIRFSRGESAKFCDWMERGGRGEKREGKSVGGSFFSRGRISVTENTGDHRSAWTGSGRFKKSLEKNRARAAMRLLLKINEPSRSLPRTDGR